MRKLMLLFVVLMALALPQAASAQGNPCWMRGSIAIAPMTDYYRVIGSGHSQEFDYSVYGYDKEGYCSYDVEAKVWVEGRNGGPSYCANHGNPGAAQTVSGGVCHSYSSAYADAVWAEMEYQHPFPLAGWWGVTTNHVYGAAGYTTKFAQQYYEPPPGPETATSEPECQQVSYNWNWSWYYWNGETCSGPSSPIIIPLRAQRGNNREEFQLTSKANGVAFDLNNDGALEQTAWTAPGSGLAFLAIDRDGNGTIDNGSELFGNYTLPGVNNGFAALDRIEAQDPDGPFAAISAGDPLYEKLLLWEDRNHNGQSEKNELSKFSERYTKIGTGYSRTPAVDKFGNQFLFMGWVEVRTAPGKNAVFDGNEQQERQRQVYDVFFTTQR